MFLELPDEEKDRLARENGPDLEHVGLLGTSGNVFANPQASSSAPYPQELNSLWKKTIEEPLHMSTAEKSERPERDQDLRCQSGPSAKNSVIFSGGDSSKNYGADQQRLQISDLHFDKFPTPATFACWKIRFKTKVCNCSQFPTEAMLSVKEVELVDPVDELRSSSSIRGISMPNFEVLDARIASALNKIIHNSHFKRRISLEEQKAQKQDSFLRGRQNVTSTSTKDLITSRMDKGIGFESCSTTRRGTVRQQEGEVVRQTKFFQSTQPNPNPIRDRSGRLENMKD